MVSPWTPSCGLMGPGTVKFSGEVLQRLEYISSCRRAGCIVKEINYSSDCLSQPGSQAVHWNVDGVTRGGGVGWTSGSFFFFSSLVRQSHARPTSREKRGARKEGAGGGEGGGGCCKGEHDDTRCLGCHAG